MNRQQKKQRRRNIQASTARRKKEREEEIEEIRDLEEMEDDFEENQPFEGDVPQELVEEGLSAAMDEEGSGVSETAEEEEKEHTEKSLYYGDDVAYPPALGATSFEQLEEARIAEEKASEIRRTTWDAEDLVRNILNNFLMEPNEKVDALKKVADGFGERINEQLADMKKDIDLVELEAMLAIDKRSMGVGDAISDFFTKATLTSSGRKALGDDKYALVVTRKGKKVRKYPIHDKAHVRNALARAAQMIKRGGEAGADARKALPKIRAAAKRMNIGSQNKERNGIFIEKDAKGDWRWLGLVSNNFIDWDRDIITKDAHEEYVAWLDEHMDMAPVFMPWHTPEGVRKNRADFAAFENGFLIMSGKLEDEEALALLRVQKETDLGMSHGTIVLKRNKEDPRLIEKYRMYEASDLPLANAANPFTDLETILKEVGMDKKQYLATIMGSEEKAQAFLDLTGAKQKELLDAEIENKEKKDETTPAAPADKPISDGQPQATLDQVVQMVMKEMDIEGLKDFVAKAQEDHEKVELLEGVIKSLQTSKEDELAEMIRPSKPVMPWSKVASQDPDTVLDPKKEEDKKLLERQPGLPTGWLSQLTNTEPVEVKNQ